MSNVDEVKFIIEQLNSPPFSRKFTLVTFDELGRNGLQLLQLLNDVFAELSPLQKVNLRDELPEQTAFRMLEFLRVLKYQPKRDPATFRQDLVQGERDAIYPLLYWILQRVDDLRKRAYLARFLVQIEVPDEFLADETIGEVHEQYRELVAQFKTLHKTVEGFRGTGLSPAEIKRDIANMEEEREQLRRRVEKAKKKIEAVRGHEKYLDAARDFRTERDRQQELQARMRDEKNRLLHAEQRYTQAVHTLKEMRTASVGGNPEALLKRIQEEHRMNKMFVAEKLPKAIEEKRKQCVEMSKILSEPMMSDADLRGLEDQIHELNAEINSYVEKRMARGEPADDKLALFRQQASIIERKKNSTAESLKDAMAELAGLEKEIERKREETKGGEGEAKMLKGDDFKRYVAQLRTKSSTYKRKKAELAELRAELVVLGRTEEVLRSRDENVKELLSKLESKKGVSGYQQTQETLEAVSAAKEDIDEQKGRTLTEISDMVKQIMQAIADKKAKLSPVIRELRSHRQQCQELEVVYEEKKATYERKLADLDTSKGRVEQEVGQLRSDCARNESQYHYLNCMTQIVEQNLMRAMEELKTYVSNSEGHHDHRRDSLRDLITKKIQEQDNLGKVLREKQRSFKESFEPNLRQLQMCRDLRKLMQCKIECMQRQQLERQGGARKGRAEAEMHDHLIL
eukprot:Opistho-1_new@101407